MDEIPNKNIGVVHLYLEKIEKLNDREREVLIETINILNHPIFVSKNI